ARAVSGVHAVLTADDIGRPLPRIPLRIPRANEHRAEPYQQPVIAAGVVRCVGEPFAVILADTAEIAEDALERIVFETEALPPVTHGYGEDSALLFPDTGSNCALLYD